MARRFLLPRLLKNDHWEPFHALLAERRTTYDMARRWRGARGYSVARSAVGRYALALSKKQNRVVPLGAAECVAWRRKIGWALNQLQGWPWAAIAATATFFLERQTLPRPA